MKNQTIEILIITIHQQNKTWANIGANLFSYHRPLTGWRPINLTMSELIVSWIIHHSAIQTPASIWHQGTSLISHFTIQKLQHVLPVVEPIEVADIRHEQHRLHLAQYKFTCETERNKKHKTTAASNPHKRFNIGGVYRCHGKSRIIIKAWSGTGVQSKCTLCSAGTADAAVRSKY